MTCVFFEVCGHNRQCKNCSRRPGLKDLLEIVPERNRPVSKIMVVKP